MGVYLEWHLTSARDRWLRAAIEAKHFLTDASTADVARSILRLHEVDRLHAFGSHRPYGNSLAWAYSKLDLMESMNSFLRNDVLGGNVTLYHYRLEGDILEDCAPGVEGAMPYFSRGSENVIDIDGVRQVLTWYEDSARDRVECYTRQVSQGLYPAADLQKILNDEKERLAFLDALEKGVA